MRWSTVRVLKTRISSFIQSEVRCMEGRISSLMQIVRFFLSCLKVETYITLVIMTNLRTIALRI